jgi:hypothetical protein
MGLQVGDNILYTLYFTVNQKVIAEDKDDLSYIVRKPQEAYEQRGLIINKKNSEYVIFGNNKEENLPLEDDYISREDKCKYLGILCNKNDNSTKEIKN